LFEPPHAKGTPVYLCLCNALTDRQVKQAVADPAAQRPTDVYAACGCRAQCGACVKTLLGLLREKTELAEGLLQGAD
jgi:bacterioferritin-associated ferredoxin